MSGIKLSYHIDMSKPIRAMQALKLVDRRELAETIGELMVSETVLNFEQQQAPDGAPWIPSERAKREGGKTLIDHAHLRDSITYIVGLDADFVEIGSNMVQAAIQQFGGETGRNKKTVLPARPYLGLTTEIENEIVEMTLDFYDQVLSDVH